jgi:hypothetical protein
MQHLWRNERVQLSGSIAGLCKTGNFQMLKLNPSF